VFNGKYKYKNRFFLNLNITNIFSSFGISINIFLSRLLGQENFGLYTLIISGIMVIELTLVAEGVPPNSV